jgi:hypothetical protein
MQKFDPETLDPRRAGLVKRYHVWPTIRTQQVDGHSWQNIRILLAVWPDAPRHLLVYAMFHDIGEVGVGDMPWPAKNLNPEMQRIMDEGERTVHEDMVERFMVPPPVEITDFERLVFKTCEYLEMMEFGFNEVNMGNRYAVIISERMHEAVLKNLGQIRTVENSHTSNYGIGARVAAYLAARNEYESGIAA